MAMTSTLGAMASAAPSLQLRRAARRVKFSAPLARLSGTPSPRFFPAVEYASFSSLSLRNSSKRCGVEELSRNGSHLLASPRDVASNASADDGISEGAPKVSLYPLSRFLRLVGGRRMDAFEVLHGCHNEF